MIIATVITTVVAVKVEAIVKVRERRVRMAIQRDRFAIKQADHRKLQTIVKLTGDNPHCLNEGAFFFNV